MSALPNTKIDRVVLDGFKRGISSARTNDAFAAFAEGGKARGIVEFCDRLHLPAIFIDRQGFAFHANAEAADYLNSELRVRGGQIISGTARGSDAIADAVSRALCAMDPAPSRRVLKIGSRRPVYLTVLDYPSRSEYQLLKVVVILGRTPSEHRPELESLVKRLEND